MKVAEEELTLWKEAAWLERLTLSAWIRAHTNQAAKRRVEKERDRSGG